MMALTPENSRFTQRDGKRVKCGSKAVVEVPIGNFVGYELGFMLYGIWDLGVLFLL